MESVIVSVKANVGDKEVQVKIFSGDKISDSTIQRLNNMNRDAVIEYGNINGWKVIDWEN